MNTDTTSSIQLPASLVPLVAMGTLLERLERQPRGAAPAQYRDVALKVQGLLGEAEPGPALEALLAALPATAELYENLHYAHAGLCRSPLEAALNAELEAKAAMPRLDGAARIR
ncbi:hypothetical protein BH11PSE10_BH11PSE10_18880 [soil metagenome]